MTFHDPWGVYDLLGDISSPPNNGNYAHDGQNRDDIHDGGVPKGPFFMKGWTDRNLPRQLFYTLPYLQKDKGSTAGE